MKAMKVLRNIQMESLTPVPPRPPPHPRLRSVTISRATPEEWFNRCAGDYQQILNAAKLPGGIGKWGGRQWFGVLGNLDEAYDFLTSFGLASEDGKQDAKKHSKLNPHQSALNKLLQFGTAARATKNCWVVRRRGFSDQDHLSWRHLQHAPDAVHPDGAMRTRISSGCSKGAFLD